MVLSDLMMAARTTTQQLRHHHRPSFSPSKWTFRQVILLCVVAPSITYRGDRPSLHPPSIRFSSSLVSVSLTFVWTKLWKRALVYIMQGTTSPPSISIPCSLFCVRLSRFVTVGSGGWKGQFEGKGERERGSIT